MRNQVRPAVRGDGPGISEARYLDTAIHPEIVLSPLNHCSIHPSIHLMTHVQHSRQPGSSRQEAKAHFAGVPPLPRQEDQGEYKLPPLDHPGRCSFLQLSPRADS